MTIRAIGVCAAVVGWVGCGVTESQQDSPTAEPSGHLEDSVVIIEPARDEFGRTEQRLTSKRILFLNGAGGTYSNGAPNSGSNTSSVVPKQASIPPYTKGAASFADLVSCVRNVFAPYNIEVTETDPGAQVTHLEVVIGGRPSLLGLGSNVGGIAPMYGNCATVEKGVAFVFEEIYSSVQKICEATAHEAGHLIGLDHEFHCPDPMTYLQGCGNKVFRDHNASCGEGSARSCRCVNPFTGDNQTQNSAKFLAQRLGVAATASPTTPACTPTTCAAQGKTCGTLPDGCGGTLNCGSCTTGQSCTNNVCATQGCVHSECTAGAKLTASCSTCAATVCARDAYCCNTQWDGQCVNEAKAWCGLCGGTATTCGHTVCNTGSALTSSCDACTGTVCAKDPYCCTTSWDAQCVAEAKSWCGACGA